MNSREDLMPVLFVGHGNPMNAIEDNAFSRGWRHIAGQLPKPAAILCISAHWETNGTFVTAMEKPRTIHDFYGFPRELYRVTYPAPGAPELAKECCRILGLERIALDMEWGLDHGTWSVLKSMYPDAGIPVIQLSLDRTSEAKSHYDLAKKLASLRSEGVLIIGSGNMVHNLGMMQVRGEDFNEPFGFDWALEANDLFKKLINKRKHNELIEYRSLGNSAALAIPTAEHYLPMLYALALQEENEGVSYFNDSPVAGSLTMTSLIIGA